MANLNPIIPQKSGPISDDDKDIEDKYGALVKKKQPRNQKKLVTDSQQKQKQIATPINSLAAESLTTNSATVASTSSSKGTDFWAVGFGSGGEKTAEKNSQQRGPKRQQQQPQSQRRGQSHNIIEDTSRRVPIVPKKIPKNAFPTLGGEIPSDDNNENNDSNNDNNSNDNNENINNTNNTNTNNNHSNHDNGESSSIVNQEVKEATTTTENNEDVPKEISPHNNNTNSFNNITATTDVLTDSLIKDERVFGGESVDFSVLLKCARPRQDEDCVQVPNKLLFKNNNLGNEGGGGGGLVFPGRRELASGLVVTGKTVDTGLDQNEAELSIAILAVALEVLADGDGLLDQVVEILGDLGGETVGLQDTEDLVTGDVLDLGNTLGVTEDDTDLGGGHTLLGELEDRVADILGGGLQPGRRRTLVGESGARDTLTTAVHATHFE